MAMLPRMKALVIALMSLCVVAAAGSPTVPTGFADQAVVTGLAVPVAR